jgi:hypothetical protein
MRCPPFGQFVPAASGVTVICAPGAPFRAAGPAAPLQT